MATDNSNGSATTYDIPKECKAGVVVNEGPNFRVEVQNVPVPEIGMPLSVSCP
jgi:propanol-preferring alcohol dehydrogenase